MVSPGLRRQLRRKSQRGNAVLVVVLVTMLVSALGVYSVRNISRIDQAVGYGRQAEQTAALAELGTTAALSYIARIDREKVKVDAQNPNLRCLANGTPPAGQAVTCYPFDGAAIESVTVAVGGRTLLEPTVTGTETGSFGPVANMRGLVDVELTDIQDAMIYTPGDPLDKKRLDATVTTRARVLPNLASGAPCDPSASAMTVKKVMRAHAIF